MTTAAATMPMTTPAELRSFSQDVLVACCMFGDLHSATNGKMFVHHVWALGRFGMGLEAFKALLIEANAAGHLTLSRCDLVAAFDPHDVRRSHTVHMGTVFNFVRF